MRSLSREEIDHYVMTDQPFQACGAYCYEKNGYRLFSDITGSTAAIKGLPLTSLLDAIRRYASDND
jgi:septum formation protein